LRAGQEALATVRGSAAWPYFLRPGVHLAVLGAVFAYLSVLSWRRWPDLIVDFGRELYVPWRIAEGDVLYRDIVHYYGPFGVSVNATLFEIFGPGFDTLFWTNLALLAAFTVALHRLFNRLAGRVTALLVGILFLVAFAFGNFTFTGNYNWVAPYSADAIYGFYLCLGLLLAFGRYLTNPRPSWLCLAGGLLGTTYLTKPEIFAAGLALTGVAGLAALWRRGIDSEERPRAWVVLARTELRAFALWLALPATGVILAVNFWFVVKIGGTAGWASVHASWLAIFQTSAITQSQTNLSFTGFNDPVANFLRLLGAGALGAVAFGVIGGLSWAAGREWKVRRGVAIALGFSAVGAAVAVLYLLREDPYRIGRLLPAAATALLIWRAHEFMQAAPGEERTHRGLALLWSALGLGLLAKMLLNPRIEHYGFFQAMPATLDLACFLLGDFPRRLRASGGAPFAATCGALLVAGLIVGLGARSFPLWRIKNFWIGADRDRIVTHPPQLWPLGRSIEETRVLVEKSFPTARTLLVLPEGVTLNYLFRKKTAVPLYEFVPSALAFYGQDRLLGQLESSPPDLIVILSRDLREFGAPVFGHDESSGRRLLDWLEPRYEVVARGGGDPLKPKEVGLVLLRRK